MSGVKQDEPAIQERISRGETVSFPYWTTMDDIGILLVTAMFVSFDVAFLFREDGSVTLFFVMLPFCLIPTFVFLRERSQRVGRELKLDVNGIYLKTKDEHSQSIAWDSLDGLFKTSKGTVVLATNGTEILFPRTLGGIKLKTLQSDILDYLADRSRWIHEKRNLVPKPPKAEVSWKWFGRYLAISIAALAGQGHYIRKIKAGEITLQDVPFGGVSIVVLSLVSGTFVILAFLAWYRIKVAERPYLWDVNVLPPSTNKSADVEQHRKDHAKSPPRIKLEQGKTYVYRKHSVSSGQIRFILWGGVPWTLLLLSTPFIGVLDSSQAQPGLTGIIVVSLVAWTIAAFFVIYIAWAAIWLRPYLSKYRLEGDEISVEYKGAVSKYQTSVIREGKLWFMQTYLGGRFEVYGTELNSFRIDRRYLRVLSEDEYFNLR